MRLMRGLAPVVSVLWLAGCASEGATDDDATAVVAQAAQVRPSRLRRDAGPDVGPDVIDVPVDLGPDTAVSPDPVAYTGSFAVRTGRWRAQLTVGGLARDVTVYVPVVRASAPPLVLAFHGTNGNGDQIFDEAGARAMADANGVVVIAPDSQWMSGGDWDHATEEGYW